ncbi:hypothetical protein J5754_05775 [bacterium]|nr:hypothetical protein [bacterium]
MGKAFLLIVCFSFALFGADGQDFSQSSDNCAKTEQPEWVPPLEKRLLSENMEEALTNWFVFVKDSLKELKDEDRNRIRENFLKECAKPGHFSLSGFLKEAEKFSKNKNALHLSGVHMLCYDVLDSKRYLERLGLYEKVLAIDIFFNDLEAFSKNMDRFLALAEASRTAPYKVNEVSSLMPGSYSWDIRFYVSRTANKYDTYLTQKQQAKVKRLSSDLPTFKEFLIFIFRSIIRI